MTFFYRSPSRLRHLFKILVLWLQTKSILWSQCLPSVNQFSSFPLCRKHCREYRAVHNVSFSNGDYRLAEEIELVHVHQQVSKLRRQQKIVLMLSLEGGAMSFGREVTQKGFVEWEVMLINISRKQAFCRVTYIPAKLMGHMLGLSPQYHSCCYSQHLSLVANGRESGLQFHGQWRSHTDFQVRHNCRWYIWAVHGKWLRLMLF